VIQTHPKTRNALISQLKAISCLMIVGHHLAFYGPMSEIAAPVVGAINAFLFDYGRMAVYVFLAVGGYLAASHWSDAVNMGKHSLTELLSRKFLRLAIPYYVAIALAILCNVIAGLWMAHESISEAPDRWQLISHLLFLQNILGYESLSAGLWFIAIDLQLFAVSALVVHLIYNLTHDSWSFQNIRWFTLLLIAAASLFSLVLFSHQEHLDVYFVYFFAAYGFGMLAAYAQQLPSAGHTTMLLLNLCVGLVLLQDSNLRICVALFCANVLYAGKYFVQYVPSSNVLTALGERSYSIFLVHFPVSLLVNGFWMHYMPHDPYVHAVGMLTAIACSIAVAYFFYALVEINLAGRFMKAPTKRLPQRVV
jgi:peptidoglycan/LPS O-acetylase OafA/YrhL